MNCLVFFVCVELSWVGFHGFKKWGFEGWFEGWGFEGWELELWAPEGWWPNPDKMGARRGGARRLGARKVGSPKIRAFFSLSRRKIRSFLPSLGVFSWNFGLVWSAGTLCCARLGSRAVVWSPAGNITHPQHTTHRTHNTHNHTTHTTHKNTHTHTHTHKRNTARELQTCTFEGPGLQKHHQNSTRRHPEKDTKNENGGGGG